LTSPSGCRYIGSFRRLQARQKKAEPSPVGSPLRETKERALDTRAREELSLAEGFPAFLAMRPVISPPGFSALRRIQ
jgi:hypothetical protein